ncbi:DNA-directed RNA polymerase III subunit RPC2 isoform 2-T9 [Synchiropus picturatus]
MMSFAPSLEECPKAQIFLLTQVLFLLFEDLFKTFETEVKRTADQIIPKQSGTVWCGQAPAEGPDDQWNAISTLSLKSQRDTRVLPQRSALDMMARISSQFEKTRKGHNTLRDG